MKVVNFATRVVTGLRKFDNVSRARDDLYLHTPRQMCDLQIAIAAHKVILYHEPADLAVLLNTHADTRDDDRVTRQDRRLRLPAMRTAAGQRSFEHRAAHLLSSMPEDESDHTPAAFKRTAKQFFFGDGLCVCVCVYVCVCVCVCICVFVSVCVRVS